MFDNLFDALPRTPAEHFKLYFYGAVVNIIGQVALSLNSYEGALERFPFLAGYNNEFAAHGFDGIDLSKAVAMWFDALSAWEQGTNAHLPLRALRQATGLDHSALTLLMSIGLIEEDARFGSLYEAMQDTPGQHRPTVALLGAWWQDSNGYGQVRADLRRLQELGLIQAINPDAPRMEWVFQSPALLWDALRGERHTTLTPWALYRDPSQLAALGDLVVADAVRQSLSKLSSLLASDQVQALIVRGPQHNGRRTVLGAVARELNCGLLEVSGLTKADDDRWRLIGPLATLLHALPVITLDLAPSEAAHLPRLDGYTGPLGVALGRQGGIAGPGAERAITLALDMPDVHMRRLHWQRSLDSHEVSDLDTISERFRMTSGNIRRAARLAQSYAALDGRTAITPAHVQQASRALNRQVLDTLAQPVPTVGDWSHLAVSENTLSDLRDLESRCRHRERLSAAVGATLGAQLHSGVRALFSGPSGTGKTLAARLLATALQMDLYRLDLSSVVNKYIGETEKNLSQVFARVEELDVILLLDEGDALLTQRTSVNTSNDRYANLETNYLLQRVESFEGILIVTTNAIERVDSAFQRRMDVVVDFRAPDVAERWTIWQLHLPPVHAIDATLLSEVAARCALTGGQIRNAALHAALLALDDGKVVTSAHLESAVQREYRKLGAVCPLRTKSN